MKECILIKKSQIDETLKSPSQQGKRLLEPLKTFSAEYKVPLNILEDKEVDNEVEVHRHQADLWLCLEGEVTFEYGGELINPWAKKNTDGSINDKEIKDRKIRNGMIVTLKAGDWLYIPAGQPHTHRTNKTARLVIIKLDEPEIPLKDVPGWKS